MKKPSLLLLLSLPILAAVLSAQSGSAVRTLRRQPGSASAAVSPERLARIDALLQQYVDEGRIAGLVALAMLLMLQSLPPVTDIGQKVPAVVYQAFAD